MRNKTNAILITRAPLNYEEGTSFEKPRTPLTPGIQFWIIMAFVSYVLITLFAFKGIKYAVELNYEMKVESRLTQIELEHKRLVNLLFLED